MPLRTLSGRGRVALCSVLLLALALAQTLGFVHRIVHAPLMLQATAGAVPQSMPAPSAAPSKHGLQALFAGHFFEHGCDLFDQASHADMLGVASVVAMPIELPSEAPARALPMWQIAAQAAGFLARGPPVVTS